MSDLIRDGERFQQYIGDGVYASFIGDTIWLRTERATGIHEIALEAAVLAQLMRYTQNVVLMLDGETRAQQAQTDPEAEREPDAEWNPETRRLDRQL